MQIEGMGPLARKAVLTHRVSFVYEDARGMAREGGIRIDRLTPRLPEILQRFVRDELGGTLMAWAVSR